MDPARAVLRPLMVGGDGDGDGDGDADADADADGNGGGGGGDDGGDGGDGGSAGVAAGAGTGSCDADVGVYLGRLPSFLLLSIILRDQVEDEFSRHRSLLRKRPRYNPPPTSTIGLGFFKFFLSLKSNPIYPVIDKSVY